MPSWAPSSGERTEFYLVEQYLLLGFTVPQAQLLIDAHADWHQASDLLEQGCDVELALLILA